MMTVSVKNYLKIILKCYVNQAPGYCTTRYYERLCIVFLRFLTSGDLEL